MDNKLITVRKAVTDDVLVIQKITREAFQMYAECSGTIGIPPALKETAEDILSDIKTKEFLVAELDGVVVGSVRIEVMQDGTAYLSRFGVAVENQSQGIGRVLMDYVDNLMRDKQVSKLYLHTASKILSLVRFYYGRGFYIDSTSKERGYIRALLCKSYEEGSYKENKIYGLYAI
ncbi:GNAT family N-acetyltransferase [Clostridium oryzae]|uniref:Bifunctional argininosuccinate lyase/N-acetylglutamate synthase n=1 Tax=Clostridium oryzae TaxID=1450648 RepID=A0A1V4IKM6_9CLOT|nr:GNAT family N-acetyltransferase [Clostridium oryzae]OPJ60384.1 bifunctional argininosuccinate lyase/N-acetylglutamate synthase [Clostridium oryzae]